jgi:ACT domain-containing protein
MRDDYKEGRKVVEVTLLNKVSFLIDQGVSVSSACKQVGIARSTYYKYAN